MRFCCQSKPFIVRISESSKVLLAGPMLRLVRPCICCTRANSFLLQNGRSALLYDLVDSCLDRNCEEVAVSRVIT